MRFERVQAAAFRLVSQTGIHYRGGRLSSSPGGLPHDAPQAGDRFPWLRLRFAANGEVEDSFTKLDDVHFHLLVFGQPAPERISGWDGLLEVHALPEDAANDAALQLARIPRPSMYLVRPDGYVGLCGPATRCRGDRALRDPSAGIDRGGRVSATQSKEIG